MAVREQTHVCKTSTSTQLLLLPRHHLPRSNPFLLVLREALNLQRLSPPPHTFPLASNAGSNRGSFGKARGHTETSPCLPHPYCGNKWCSAGWSSRMPLPTLLLSPWELSGPQRPKNTFLFSWGELCSVGGGRTCSRCGWC